MISKSIYNSVLAGVAAIALVNCGSKSHSFAIRPSIEAVIPQCREVASSAVAPKLKWDWYSQLSSSPDSSYPAFDQVMAAPVVGDLNGDGIPEVVFVTFTTKASEHFSDAISSSHYSKNGVLRIVDGKTGRNLKSIGSQALAPYATFTPLLVDIDRDGKMEIAYLHYKNDVIVLNHDGSLRWKRSYATPMSRVATGFTASDANGDGIAEILAGRELLTENANKQPIVLFSSTDMGNDHRSVIHIALDPARPSQTSFVTHEGVFNNDGTRRFGFTHGALFTAVADIIPEKKGLEIIANGNGRLSIYNGLTGDMLSSTDLTQYNDLKCPSGNIGGGPVSVGDFDGDTDNLEIAVATGRHLTIFDKNSIPKYKVVTQDCSSLATALTSFDLNGDKKPEVLYADEEYLRIYEVVNGELKIRHQIVNPSGTLAEYPVVADIDGNLSAEIVLVSNNYAVGSFYTQINEAMDKVTAASVTGVRAFTSAGESAWMPTRPIWNQFNFHPDQFNDQGQLIPLAQVDPHIFRRNNQGYNTIMNCRK